MLVLTPFFGLYPQFPRLTQTSGARAGIADTKSQGSGCTPDAKIRGPFYFVKMLKERGLEISISAVLVRESHRETGLSHTFSSVQSEFVSDETG
jgi:hypothetical protein